jgi:hypothetical protein
VKASLQPAGSVTGVRGERVACGPGGSWAAGERRSVVSDGVAILGAPRALDGALRFSTDGSELLAGTERFDLSARTWAKLADPRPAVAEDRSGLVVVAAAWAGAGEMLAVAAQRRPVRRPGAGASSRTRPDAWLTLLDGRARTPVRTLWSGFRAAPRHVALEGGLVAADAEGRARLWTADGEEFAPDAGRLIGLALGDHGDLLALVGLDGSVTLWRGPRFDAAEPVGDGAQGAVAVAAGAPVVAWARGDGAAVWAGGTVTRLAAPAIRTLALDAEGRRLVALDGASVLHRAAIAW